MSETLLGRAHARAESVSVHGCYLSRPEPSSKKKRWCLELAGFASEGGKEVYGIQAAQCLAHAGF